MTEKSEKSVLKLCYSWIFCVLFARCFKEVTTDSFWQLARYFWKICLNRVVFDRSVLRRTVLSLYMFKTKTKC